MRAALELTIAEDHPAAIVDEPEDRFDEELAATAELIPASLATFRASIDPAWIEEALLTTGTATIRRRRLPAEQVIWLVLGMALMRNTPIAEIVRRLDLALPDADWQSDRRLERRVASTGTPRRRASRVAVPSNGSRVG